MSQKAQEQQQGNASKTQQNASKGQCPTHDNDEGYLPTLLELLEELEAMTEEAMAKEAKRESTGGKKQP